MDKPEEILRPQFLLLETSKETDKIDQARFDLAARMENIKRDKENPFFSSKYVPLDKVLEVTREPLHEEGLLLTVAPSQSAGEVCVETRLTHVESGQFVSVKPSAPVAPDKRGNVTPQGVGAAVTYLRRYGLMPLLGIAETDDDGNISSATPLDERPSWVGPLDEKELKDELRKVWSSIERAKTPEKLEQALWQYQGVITQCKADLPYLWDGTDGIKGIHTLLARRQEVLAGPKEERATDPDGVLEEIENRLSGIEGLSDWADLKMEYDTCEALEHEMYRTRADDLFHTKKMEIDSEGS